MKTWALMFLIVAGIAAALGLAASAGPTARGGVFDH